MNKFTPDVYLIGIFVAISIIWFMGAEDRLMSLTWSLPGILVGTFTILWKAITRLEKRITKLEAYIEELENKTESTNKNGGQNDFLKNASPQKIRAYFGKK